MRTEFLQALPPYLGGKRRLVPLIFGLIARTISPAQWIGTSFLDPMCGGGAVALSARAYGFDVVASDAAQRGVVVSRAVIANSGVRLTRHQLLDFLHRASSTERGWDSLFAAAESFTGPIQPLIQLVLIKAYLRSFPMSSPGASDAPAFIAGDLDAVSPRRLNTYLNGRQNQTPDTLWRIACKVNAGVIGGTGSALKGDALEIIPKSSPDLLYLDPPYGGTVGYRDTYRNLDRMLGDESATAPPGVNELLESATEVPMVVLSYGGPDISAEQISRTVERHRHVIKAIEVPYVHLNSIATTERRRKTREVIIIAER